MLLKSQIYENRELELMSDDKLKSEDEKPSSRKSRPTTTRIKSATKAPERKAAAEGNAEKVKSTSTSKKEPVAEKNGTAKNKVAQTNPKTKATNKETTDKAVAISDLEKATDQVPKVKNKKASPEKEVAEKNVSDTDVVKTESKPVPRPRKNKSITKMASVAAILFLGVLLVFLLAKDPDNVEGQTTSTAPSTTVTAPNPNASSPYGMRVEQLKEVEVLLLVLNFDPGNIDGEIDHETVAAISLFQQISGLEVDGRPSQVLLNELKAVDELLNQ